MRLQSCHQPGHAKPQEGLLPFTRAGSRDVRLRVQDVAAFIGWHQRLASLRIFGKNVPPAR